MHTRCFLLPSREEKERRFFIPSCYASGGRKSLAASGIKENISCDILMQEMKFDGDRLDEIVDLMLETVFTRRKTIRIARDDYLAELVKAKFMKHLFFSEIIRQLP